MSKSRSNRGRAYARFQKFRYRRKAMKMVRAARWSWCRYSDYEEVRRVAVRVEKTRPSRFFHGRPNPRRDRDGILKCRLTRRELLARIAHEEGLEEICNPV